MTKPALERSFQHNEMNVVQDGLVALRMIPAPRDVVAGHEVFAEERPGNPDGADWASHRVFVSLLLLEPPHVRVVFENVDGRIRMRSEWLAGDGGGSWSFLMDTLGRLDGRLLATQTVMNRNSLVRQGLLLGRAFEVELGLQMFLKDHSARQSPVARLAVILKFSNRYATLWHAHGN